MAWTGRNAPPNRFSNVTFWRTHPTRHLRLAALIFGLGYFVDAGTALAEEVVNGAADMKAFPASQIFTFLLLMLGPFKIIGPFLKITNGADAGLTYRIAMWSTLFSALALLFAAFLGERILSQYGIPLPILALSAGIILFLVALNAILEQFAPPAPHNDRPLSEATPTINLALTPLALPTIITPYGIAAFVVFLAFAPDRRGQLIIGAIVVAIMLLNLIVMVAARHLPSFLGVLLQILGAVLGVVQVALGLKIMNNSLKALGVM